MIVFTKDGLRLMMRLFFFLVYRSQMQTIITKACKEIGIKPIPSKRVGIVFRSCFKSMINEVVSIKYQNGHKYLRLNFDVLISLFMI